MENTNINSKTIVSICNRLIRSFINVLYPSLPDYQPWEVLNKSFSIHTRNDWFTLCSAMDLIDDTESAKENYSKFGLSGPTKYNEVGEKYLRMYGLLNAFFLQKEAIIAILKFCNLSDLKKEKEEIEKLQIMKLRNIAGSHTMSFKDYSNKKEKSKNSFMITRFSLDSNNISFRNEEGVEKISIINSFIEYNRVIGKKLFIAVEYLSKSLKSSCKEELNEYIDTLRHINRFFDGEVYTVSEDSVLWNVGDIDFSNADIEIYDGINDLSDISQ